MDVISELVGVPASDRAEVRRLADLLVHREEGMDDIPPEGLEAALTLAGYYADMVADRRRHERDDLTWSLLHAEIDGDRLTDDEVIGFLFLLSWPATRRPPSCWATPGTGAGATPTSWPSRWPIRPGSPTGSRRRCATTPRRRCWCG